MSDLTTKLIAALKNCPCCGWSRTAINTCEDGIPESAIHESVFQCGARAFVTATGRFRISMACPGPLEDELDELEDRIRDAAGEDKA